MLPDDPLAHGRRRRVLVTTVIAVLLLGAVAVKLTSMQLAQIVGERAWRSGDPVAAERYFALTGRLNLVERWISPYNSGVAAYARQEWGVAADRFEESLALAPASAHCRVALSWSWTLEAAGDELAASGDEAAAADRWARAKQVLEQAEGCDDGGSSAPPPASGEQPDTEQGQADQTEERLDGKLGNDTGEPGPRPEPEKTSEDERAEKLDDRNRGAAQDKQRSEDRQAQQDRGDNEEPADGPDRTW